MTKPIALPATKQTLILIWKAHTWSKGVCMVLSDFALVQDLLKF